ncbi:MAG: discoidin domain-containing protein, partial [Clostridia bacterium]|nr:discoidin domain-containing protein [Clostridia bacterium]
ITPWAWGAWPYLNQEPSEKLSAYGSFMKKYFEKCMEEKAVTLYSKVDYSGDSYTLEAGKYTKTHLSDMGFKLEKLASAASKEDAYQYTVTLYEKEDYSGKSYTFVPDATNVSKEICGFTPNAMTIERTVPVNIIPGHATVQATGSVENQVEDNVIDGKTGTFWKNTDTKPNEVVICLDGVYALNRLTIAHASEASMMSVFNASDYTVSISTDGKTFTRIIDVTDNALGLCEYSFEQAVAAYIKIRITKGSIVDNSNYYLSEVMAYGTKYNGSTDGMDIILNNYNEGSAEEVVKAPVLQIVLICVFGAIIIASVVLIIIFSLKGKRRA